MGKIGIVLGGGGIRSAAHIGVLRELERVGIPIHHVAGTSAGSIVGALFAAGLSLERIEQEARQLNWRRIFEPSIILRKAISGIRLMRFLDDLLGPCKTFDSLQCPLSITAVELVEGRLVVFEEGPLLPAIRASIALPGMIQPVARNGGVLVDGAVLGSVPTHTLRDAGCDVVIAVDVRSTWGIDPARARRLRRDHLIGRVGEVMSSHITDHSLAQADIVIRPEVNGVETFNVKAIASCIDAGRHAVQLMREQLVPLASTDSFELVGGKQKHT